MATENHAETTSEGGISGVFHMFNVRGDLFLGQLTGFLIVLSVMWLFAYKPVLKMLTDREARIAKSVKDAEEIEKRMIEAEKERAAMVAIAQKEAQAMLVKAAADTEIRKTEMVEAAKREVERVIQKGKEKMKEDHAAMLIEARKDLVEIAVKAAAKILSTGLDEKKSASLAEEVVRKLT